MAEYKDLTAQLRLFETVCRHSEKPDIADLVRSAWQAIEGLQQYEELYREIAEKSQETARSLINAYPHWIPVTERLPEVDKNVLVFACGNEITIGRMKRQTENGYHVFIICHGIARELARPGRITHWMPLPSAPTEE